MNAAAYLARLKEVAPDANAGILERGDFLVAISNLAAQHCYELGGRDMNRAIGGIQAMGENSIAEILRLQVDASFPGLLDAMKDTKDRFIKNREAPEAPKEPEMAGETTPETAAETQFAGVSNGD